MQIAQEIRNVENNLSNAVKAKIAVNAKAFQVLSSNLYSDKILAVVRELCTNAYDAHIEAGVTQTSFEVFGPNTLSPVFRIRDYGLGLDEQNIYDLYMTYFGSSKSHSNEMIGGLGLGSKSPLAYTDSFSVTSYHNGVRKSYIVYKNESGEPCVSLIETISSIEPSGLEITVAVDRFDYQKFEHAIKRILINFPRESFDTPVAVPYLETIEKDELYTIYKTSPALTTYSYSSEQFVKMGNVLYEINWDIALADEGLEYLRQSRGTQINNLVIHGEIGEFDIQPSRESLSYDSNTKQKLSNKLYEVNQKLNEVLVDAFQQKYPTIYDKGRAIVSLLETLKCEPRHAPIPIVQFLKHGLHQHLPPTAVDEDGENVYEPFPVSMVSINTCNDRARVRTYGEVSSTIDYNLQSMYRHNAHARRKDIVFFETEALRPTGYTSVISHYHNELKDYYVYFVTGLNIDKLKKIFGAGRFLKWEDILIDPKEKVKNKNKQTTSSAKGEKSASKRVPKDVIGTGYKYINIDMELHYDLDPYTKADPATQYYITTRFNKILDFSLIRTVQHLHHLFHPKQDFIFICTPEAKVDRLKRLNIPPIEEYIAFLYKCIMFDETDFERLEACLNKECIVNLDVRRAIKRCEVAYCSQKLELPNPIACARDLMTSHFFNTESYYEEQVNPQIMDSYLHALARGAKYAKQPRILPEEVPEDPIPHLAETYYRSLLERQYPCLFKKSHLLLLYYAYIEDKTVANFATHYIALEQKNS